MEYLKRKMCKIKTSDFESVGFPRYYEENDRLIKECENGEKWVVTLDANYREVLLEKLQ